MSSADGSVMVYRCDRRQERLLPSQRWTSLHGRGSSCTSVTVSQDGSIVSSGEDNKICHLSVDSKAPLRTIGQYIVVRHVQHSKIAQNKQQGGYL